MIYTIENDNFILSVKEMGAELHSFKSKKTDIEYIWQGDENIWYGQSPILFPIIGRLLDDKYRLNGKEYSMPKHGIVRKKPFKLIDKTNDSLTFEQKSDEESLKMYPYEFSLKIKFQINEKGLKVNHTVTNKNKNTMYFSFGAHPAFNCKIGDYLEFQEDEELFTEQISEDALLIDESFPVFVDDKKLYLTDDLFVNDALILNDFKSKYVTLKSFNHNRSVKFNFDSPTLGIWAKPNAPYVCIEPWWGINDNHQKVSDFSNKRGIMSLEKNNEKSFEWSIEISE